MNTKTEPNRMAANPVTTERAPYGGARGSGGNGAAASAPANDGHTRTLVEANETAERPSRKSAGMDTSATVTLFTHRPAFEQEWARFLNGAGLGVTVARPEQLPRELERGAAIVVDAGSEPYDEDELLAHVGLARALGAVPVVSLPAPSVMSSIDIASIDDILDDLCGGLVSSSVAER